VKNIAGTLHLWSRLQIKGMVSVAPQAARNAAQGGSVLVVSGRHDPASKSNVSATGSWILFAVPAPPMTGMPLGYRRQV